MSLLSFKCLTIRLLEMLFIFLLLFQLFLLYFNYLPLMFAIMYSFRKPVPAKLSYFSINLNYGQKQIAKPKWKSCQGVEKLASDKVVILASTTKSAFGINPRFAVFRKS